MRSDGTKQILMGSLFVCAGSCLSLLGSSVAAPGSGYVVFVGAVIFGGVQLLYGFAQYVQFKRTPRPANPFATFPLPVQLLFRAMVASAELGGSLDERTIESIRTIMCDVCRKDFDTQSIVNGCMSLWNNGESITSELFNNFSKIPIEFRRTIIRASHIILSNGQVRADKKRDFLLYASRALTIPDEEFSSNTGLII